MSMILSVSPSPGLIDSLLWHVQLNAPSGDTNERMFLPKWNGSIIFGGGSTERRDAELSLPLVWESEVDDARSSSGVLGRRSVFRSMLHDHALDRIERYRSGGKLTARVEGKFQTLFLGPHNATAQTSLERIVRGYVGPQTLWLPVVTPAFDIPRDQWVEGILQTLRPAHRAILECCIPEVDGATDPAAVRAICHLSEAQREFDYGRYDGVAMATFKALEAIQSVTALTEQRYGEFAKKRIGSEIAALIAIANQPRHDEAKSHSEPVNIDRATAQHLLLAARSVAALVLQPKLTKD